jgi:hypothetical protein
MDSWEWEAIVEQAILWLSRLPPARWDSRKQHTLAARVGGSIKGRLKLHALRSDGTAYCEADVEGMRVVVGKEPTCKRCREEALLEPLRRRKKKWER